MIDVSWLTRKEAIVLGAALDVYRDTLEVFVKYETEEQRAEAATWQLFVCDELRARIAQK